MAWIGALVGGAATLIAGNRAARSQQSAVDAQVNAANQGNSLSREQFDWNKWVYENDIAPANRANQELQLLLAEDYLDTSRQQKDFAQEQRDEYVRTALPNERRMFEDAANYDSDANVRRRAGTAVANVNQQFSNAQGQLARGMGRYGLNSSAFGGNAARMAVGQAAAAAGAGTGAAFDTQDKAIALRAGAANFGRNMPNTAGNFLAGSNNSNAGASGASSASAGAAGAGVPMVNAAYTNRIGGLYGSAGLAGQAQLGAANMWGNVAQGLGSLTGAAIQGAGGWGAVGQGLRNWAGGLFGSGSTNRQMDTAPFGTDVEGYLGGGA